MDRFHFLPKVFIACLIIAYLITEWFPVSDKTLLYLFSVFVAWLISEIYSRVDVTDPYRGIRSTYAIIRILNAGAETSNMLPGNRYTQAINILDDLNKSYDKDSERLDNYIC